MRQAVHNTWSEADTWMPERFLPGGEFARMPDDIRPFMVRACSRCSDRDSASSRCVTESFSGLSEQHCCSDLL